MTEKDYINIVNLIELRSALKHLHNVMVLDVDDEKDFLEAISHIHDMMRYHEKIISKHETN